MQYALNTCFRDTELKRKPAVGGAFRVFSSNGNDVVSGQLARSYSPLLRTIRLVLLVHTKEQMIGVNARRAVASVAHEHTARVSLNQHVGDPMRAEPLFEGSPPVSLLVQAALPQPAAGANWKGFGPETSSELLR